MNVGPSVGPDAIVQASWQDIHRRNTPWLISPRNSGQNMVGQRRAIAAVPDSSLGVLELDWVRHNTALVYLLRTGHWQPVPSVPPDIWVERLVTATSGITTGAARKILTIAIAAVPQPVQASLLEPLSLDEHEWAVRNTETVRGLSNGQLQGIPTSPTRTWIAAFQLAVGGKTGEIAAILAIIVNVMTTPSSAMVAAE